MADDFDLPNHDEIKKEVNSLIENDLVEKSKATVLQKIKSCVSQSDGYIEITSENAPNIYKLLNSVANTIDIDIPLKVYINTTHSISDNCCNAFIGKNDLGVGNETYLSVGNKLLCELTPAETKAILEHRFMYIKDNALEKITPTIIENSFLIGACLGFWSVLTLIELDCIVNHPNANKYLNAAIVTLVASLLSYLSIRIASRVDNNTKQITDVLKTLGQNASLNVSSKTDLASGLKKIMAMLIIETLKYNPSKINKSVISIMESKIQDAIIKHMELLPDMTMIPCIPSFKIDCINLKESTETTTASIV